MELVDVFVPVGSALFAFIGAVVGTRTDIVWIKKVLDRHDTELMRIHSRISSVQKKVG